MTEPVLAVVYVGSGSGGLLVFLLLFGFLFFVLPAILMRGAFRTSRVLTQQYEAYPYPPPLPQRSAQPQPVDAAEVQSVVARLAHDVQTLQPGDDGVARQAMADASERYATASSLLERARSQDQLRTAWLAAAEGLHATRLVRTRLGVDPGPAPALPPSEGPQLQQPSRVVVEGREHVGQPAYAPGYGHWFPGGRVGDRYVPGGWYREPFWPGDLVLGVLSGWALSSLMTSAMFGGFGFPYGDGYGDVGAADGGWGEGDGGGGWGDAGDGGGWGDGGSWGDGGGGGWGDMGGGDFGGGDFGGGGDW